MTQREAADQLGISGGQLRKLVGTGKIRGNADHTVDQDAIDAYLKREAITAKAAATRQANQAAAAAVDAERREREDAQRRFEEREAGYRREAAERRALEAERARSDAAYRAYCARTPDPDRKPRPGGFTKRDLAARAADPTVDFYGSDR